ncbi:A disintegrin and metalloproteinase with thrombospondin motifs 13 [Polypterus senegalus]|uniref:A disintegrin and metalloproteinase with thrombospondin motifs 13 n=1 Tax=Polypterus senegalus TaxID=55291 RepID=UPI001962F8EF|nr:A disintegrin and metalloproteinase with thrombospondin motifs 13 [Polypterus senegalus]
MARTILLLISLLLGLALLRNPAKEIFEKLLRSEDPSVSFGQLNLNEAEVHLRQRRAAADTEVRHLELLVVVGADVQQAHLEDTERYILTNLNIASELLRDASLGASLRVHLIRMLILSEPQVDIQISSNITSSLISVCQWSSRQNPGNDSDPLHADLVLYITRFDLELPDGNKQVRGVTQLGGACSHSWSCVITEDTGFDLGVTIAHEIGHSFGINHDGIGNGCKTGGFIMASEGGYNSVDLSWSQCSREQFLVFLSQGKANCLSDLPDLEGSLPGWKPGLYYGADDQCKIAFGRGARACTFQRTDIDVCRVLSCHTNPSDHSSCTRMLIPLLDGTECGPNKWCLKGRCVSPQEVRSLLPVNGAWSGWTAFSPCSRTCGGGVTFRRRQCNNPRPAFGGRKCEGKHLEAKLCNRQPCLTIQVDFMAEQCSQTNTEPLFLTARVPSYHKWTPALGFAAGDAQCKLLCRSEGKNFMMSRGSQFIDGTRCELGSPTLSAPVGICVAGECREFGCDGDLDSKQVLDVCGVCGGNGSSCTEVTGDYSEGRSREYVTFLTIPPNATTVHVVNNRSLFTHLAVKIKSQYVLAGKGSISMNRTHPSTLEDHRMDYKLYLTTGSLPNSEELFIRGPVEDETQIQVFRKYDKEYGEITNPNITYSYYLPTIKSTFSWVAVTSACSVTCGGGVQKTSYTCADAGTKEKVAEEKCKGIPQPAVKHQLCNVRPCPPRWEVGEFGPCTLSCGGGVRMRPLRCLRKEKELTVKLPHHKCPRETMPVLTEVCGTAPCPASWRAQAQGPCSATCGGGVLPLHIYCARDAGAQEEALPDEDCGHLPQPEAFEGCGTAACPPRWSVSHLGNCSAICGPGVTPQTSICVQSVDGSDIEVDHAMCPPTEKPLEFLPCVVSVCPVGWDSWHSSEAVQFKMTKSKDPIYLDEHPVYVWSPVTGPCSETCGGGLSEIHYVCVEHRSKNPMSEKLCEETTRPETRQETCNPEPCPPQWELQAFGPCSASCGQGMAMRAAHCVRMTSSAMVSQPESVCDGLPKPTEQESCQAGPCPARWRYQSGACSASCGGGLMRRVLYCVRDGDGSEEVLPNEECSTTSKPEELETCNPEPCPPRWKASEATSCSSSCGFGVAERIVACVQFHQGVDTEVDEARCPMTEKPPSVVPCMITMCPFSWKAQNWTECSVTCGYGVQSRMVSCIGQAVQQPLNPLFCMHLPKPITLQGCQRPSCPVPTATTPSTVPRTSNAPVTAIYGPPSVTLTLAPRRLTNDSYSPCGELLLEDTGVVDLRDVGRRDCLLSVGRPLGEVLEVKVVSSSLNCKEREFVLFYEQLMLLKKCERLTGYTITSRSNVLMIRQGRLAPGRGILLHYWSKAATKRHHSDCDVQLFGVTGKIVNPIQSQALGHQSCRTFVNVAPRRRIEIRALSMNMAAQVNGSYILIRDVDIMRTWVFHGNSLFFWRSSGSRAEIEFHGEYLRRLGTFHGEFSAIEP